MTQMSSNVWGSWTVFAQSGAPATPQAGAAPVPAAPQTTAAPASGTAAPASGTTTAPGGTIPPNNPGAGSLFSGPFGIMMILLVVFMLIMPMLAGRKEKKKRAELMASIKKQDKVQMLGGIIGTIVEMGDDDVVIRVEEGKIRFHKSAIQTVVASRGKSDASITELKGEAKATAV
jgi:preprotein translocase subunit YajC